MDVEGQFFNDPPNPGGAAGEPFMGLWDFEGNIDYNYFCAAIYCYQT